MNDRLVRCALSVTACITLATGAHADMPMLTVYTVNCSGCHGAEGLGVPEVGIPDLNEAGRLVRTELGREYLIQVPGLSQSRLDDATAARLLNWILRKFSANRLPADFGPTPLRKSPTSEPTRQVTRRSGEMPFWRTCATAGF
jgi:hypothetical protein